MEFIGGIRTVQAFATQDFSAGGKATGLLIITLNLQPLHWCNLLARVSTTILLIMLIVAITILLEMETRNPTTFFIRTIAYGTSCNTERLLVAD